jgi:hypothetical protein
MIASMCTHNEFLPSCRCDATPREEEQQQHVKVLHLMALVSAQNGLLPKEQQFSTARQPAPSSPSAAQYLQCTGMLAPGFPLSSVK